MRDKEISVTKFISFEHTDNSDNYYLHLNHHHRYSNNNEQPD